MTRSVIVKHGINDRSRPTKVNYKRTKHYSVWLMLMSRCLDEDHKKKHPAYMDCTISENFKNYSYFYDWCERQIGFHCEDSLLDKDLLFPDNKLYSENTCTFIPILVNNSLSKKQKNSGCYPMGVSIRKNTGVFRAIIGKYNKKVELGTFSTPEAASAKYKMEKKKYLIELAEIYKHRLDPRAYDALINYDVEKIY